MWCSLAGLAGLALRLVYPMAVVLMGRQHIGVAAALIGLSVAVAVLGAGASSRAVQRLRPVIFRSLASAARRQPLLQVTSSAQVESDIARGAPWVETYLAYTLPALASCVIALPIIAALAMAVVGVVPTVLGVLVVGIAFGLALMGVRRALVAGRATLTSYQAIARMIERGVRGAAELRVHGLGRRFERAVLDRVDEWSRLERRTAAIGAVSAWSIPAVTVLCAAVLLLVSGRRDLVTGALAQPGRATVIGTLLAVSAFPVLVVLARSLMQAASQRASLDLLDSFVASAAPDRLAHVPVGKIGCVRLCEARLRHVDEPDGEITADFEWRADMSLALEGPTGAGKTSVIHLLMGLVRPTSGVVDVEVGGESSTPDALVGNVVYVPQRPYFDDGESIRDAIRFLEPNASEEDMRATLGELVGESRHAALDLDRTIGSLSAGERRIVAIARALLKEAQLLVIDEPEMNLDRASRAAVAAALRRQKKTRRLLVATHDPEVAGVADTTLHFEGHALRAPALVSAPDARVATGA